MYRKRFGLSGHPIPKDAHGKTFFEQGPAYRRLERAFGQHRDDPGLGVLTGEAGVGKTAAMRHLCRALPKPDYLVMYLCDTAVAPLDLYRTLATEIGVRPSHRRAQLWTDIKKALVHMVDERAISPVIVLDEAQHLSDRFLIDLSGFLNFAFDVSGQSEALFPSRSSPPTLAVTQREEGSRWPIVQELDRARLESAGSAA